MNVNQKGYIGLASVIRDLASKGYEIFLPQHDYSAVDLIVMNDHGIPKRIQVKYREARDGVVRVPLRSVVNKKQVAIDRKKIDGWAIFEPTTGKILYVPLTHAEHAKTEFAIRMSQQTTRRRPTTLAPAPLYTEFEDASKFW